jgi:hypothetical protein
MKRLGFLLASVVLLSVLAVPSSSAQSIVWTSGFQVQNLSDSSATVVIAYYNQDGTKNVADASDTIPASSSKTYYPIHANDGFNGSVVVSSDRPVVAIANTLGNSTQYAASTEGFSEGATSVMLPLIMRNNGGYYTWFNVQNTGSGAASVTVQYVPGSSGTGHTSTPVSIPPGASYTFNQRDLTAIGSKFVGSAIVTSDQPVVATVMQVGETYKNMMGYNGFTDGSGSVSLPLIMANNSGYFTGYQVQNVGSTSALVTITYGANLAGSFAPAADTVTLAPDQSATFIQSGGQWTGTFVGSATITCSEPVVAIVNQVKQTGTPLGTAYNGFDPALATDKVSAPLIMANNNGYYTGVQVMNVGSGTASITLDYGPNVAGSFAPASEVATIAPGNSYNSIQAGGAWGSNKYVGSITVTGGGGDQLVMIVNQIWPAASGDQFMTYNGFNY